MKLVNSKKLYKLSKSILAGPSTMSKGVDQFAYGITPYAIERGDGAYVWDVDGNKYLETIMALGPIILGYNHPYVNEAIKHQLEKGITFSLSHSLEVEVAEMLCDRIPCAELVRFAKNGNDVTSAAIRLSRYVTRSDHVIFCGYHGWQDWYACQTSMDGGIPKKIKDYSHRFEYNNLGNLETLLKKYSGNIACIIMEATNIVVPDQDYLQSVRKLADKYNALLIFDEIVTGFRFDRGGYQKVCGVIPDLATFSKAIANGMPLSVLVGKKEIMEKCPDVLITMTFAGESLSLAAAKATMEVIDKENVIEKIEKTGKILMNKIKDLITDSNLNDIISIEGYPQRNVIIFKDYDKISADDIRTYWIQELTKKKVLTLGYHMPSLAYKEKEVEFLLGVYCNVLKDIYLNINDASLIDKLQCPSSSKFSIRD